MCIIYTSRENDFVKFARRNLKVSHHRHILVANTCKIIYMFMIYLETKLHMPSYNGQLPIRVKRKGHINFAWLSYCLTF
jgi:hypothetical protein